MTTHVELRFASIGRGLADRSNEVREPLRPRTGYTLVELICEKYSEEGDKVLPFHLPTPVHVALPEREGSSFRYATEEIWIVQDYLRANICLRVAYIDDIAIRRHYGQTPPGDLWTQDALQRLYRTISWAISSIELRGMCILPCLRGFHNDRVVMRGAMPYNIAHVQKTKRSCRALPFSKTPLSKDRHGTPQ